MHSAPHNLRAAVFGASHACGQSFHPGIMLRESCSGRLSGIEDILNLSKLPVVRLHAQAPKVQRKMLRHTSCHAACASSSMPRQPQHNPLLLVGPAETLKYLYLLFSPPSALPADMYVLNTEAHPLRVASGAARATAPAPGAAVSAFAGSAWPVAEGLGVI